MIVTRKILIPLTLLHAYFLPFVSSAQLTGEAKIVDSLFSGIWKGFSLCQQKNTACNDEQVVYYISPMVGKHLVPVRASKIVSGREINMGDIEFRFDPDKVELVSDSSKVTLWKLKRSENKIQGALYVGDSLYRIVTLSR